MDRGSGDLEHRGRSDEMAHFVGLDVSVKETSVCVVDDAGKVILEQKVPTEPSDIIALLTSLGVTYGRIGIEAGPLSQWLFNVLTAAELPVICVETRHMKALLMAQQVNKTDRNDARGIAQMMRVGLFKPVHVKTLVAQEQRMLLTSRKLFQRKLLDVECDLRGTLRNFGLKIGGKPTLVMASRLSIGSASSRWQVISQMDERVSFRHDDLSDTVEFRVRRDLSKCGFRRAPDSHLSL